MTERTLTPILDVRNVCKSFGKVYALEDVSLKIFPSEIVGVVGENGAGKTTLMKSLVGIHVPEKGEWYDKGVKAAFPKDPKDAAKKGISIVYQERGVVPSLQVYQFLFLGNEEKYVGAFGLQIPRMKKAAQEIIDEFHIKCDIEDFMFELPLSTQKMVEIARAVVNIRLEQNKQDADSVIILDEPTAPLNIEERHELLNEIVRLKANCSFVFVTHIMQEVMEYMDRVIVLRDGRQVGEYDMATNKVTENELVRMILGKDIDGQEKIQRIPSRVDNSETVLSSKELSKRGSYYNISFDLSKGECLGVLGSAGSGKSELIETIAGINGYDEGDLLIRGKSTKNHELPYARLKKGVGYFSGEIANELFYDWPITKNISILNIEKIVTKIFHFLNFKTEKTLAADISKQLRIKTPNVNITVSSLSGGNKQKVTVGKWLEKKPDILLLEDPTIGIDVGAREDIYETILNMKEQGISMILVSDDPKEYSALCDRVLMMQQGKAQKIISKEELKEVLQT
jgi:ABC-type sugar transport system ATPase subunit